MLTTLSSSGKRRRAAFFLAIPLLSFIISQSNIVTKKSIKAPAMAKAASQAMFDCPCTIFTSSETPATPRANDANALELGVKFRSSQNGFITGIRYYKGDGTTGIHLGHLWNSAGQ